MKRILFTIAYDGTNYYGWQKQNAEDQKTVQETFESALSRLFKQRVECIGASRTDRGVHALGQRAVCDVETSIPEERLLLAVNTYLPPDIRVMKAEFVANDFHPRYMAKNKTYEYKIYNNSLRNPLLRNFTEFVYKPLDEALMNEAAKLLLGTHDFKAFCSTGSSAKTTVRTIYSAEVKRNKDMVILSINGNGFLYNMVRIIAGTLIYIGMGKLPKEVISKMLETGERKIGGITASPCGLTLLEINYF